MKLEEMVDMKKEVAVADTSVSFKDRIVKYLLDQKGFAAPVEQLLKDIDPKYDGSNFSKRKHCLDSQKTYMKQDLNVYASYVDEGKTMQLDGLKIDGVVRPFKAV